MLSLIEERYASSLFELAKEENIVDKTLEELKSLKNVFEENPDFLKLLSSPAVTFKEKNEIISKAFSGKLSSYVENFLLFMTERGRVSSFLGACEAFKNYYYEESGICEATVISVTKLSDSQKMALSEKLTKLVSKKVILSCTKDPSIMGGLIIKIGNEQIDSSVKTRLWEISSQMKQINA